MEEQEILSLLKSYVARHDDIRLATQDAPVPAVSYSPGGLSNNARRSAEIGAARDAVGRLNPRNPGILNDLVQRFKKLQQRSLTWYTRSLQAFHEQVAVALQEHGAAISFMEQNVTSLQNEIAKLRTEVAALRSPSDSSHPGQRNETVLPGTGQQPADSRRIAREFLQNVSPVLDLRCGRGDFLQLMKDSGIQARGVDSNPAACSAARRRGLNVVHSDALPFLTQLPNSLLGGVFCPGVFERLSPEQQIELVVLIADKLKPGGIAVIETVDGNSNEPDSWNGYNTPRPISPPTLICVLESRDFQILRTFQLAWVEGPAYGATHENNLDSFGREGRSANANLAAYVIAAQRVRSSED